MKRLVLVICIALVAASTAAAIEPPPPPPQPTGGVRYMDANLVAAQEVPRPTVPAPKAFGTFHATGSFDCDEGEQNCVSKPGKVTWRLTFSKLTGKAVAAHLHFGKKGRAGAVAIPLCAQCLPGAHGTLSITRKVWEAAGDHRLYVNVHTATKPAGEIRGQIALSAVL